MQRRTHLVGKVFGKARQLDKAVGQARQHLVERCAQLLQLLRFFQRRRCQLHRHVLLQAPHVDGGGLLRHQPHRPQRALADQPAQYKRQQRPAGQRRPQGHAVAGQHALALGQHLGGDHGEPAVALPDVDPRQPRRLAGSDIGEADRGRGRQGRQRQAARIDSDQQLPLGVEHPQGVVAVAQHVGVQLRAPAQRLDTVAVGDQRAHAIDPACQRDVVAPRQLACQGPVQEHADGPQQQRACQGKPQRQAHAQRTGR